MRALFSTQVGTVVTGASLITLYSRINNITVVKKKAVMHIVGSFRKGILDFGKFKRKIFINAESWFVQNQRVRHFGTVGGSCSCTKIFLKYNYRWKKGMKKKRCVQKEQRVCTCLQERASLVLLSFLSLKYRIFVVNKYESKG